MRKLVWLLSFIRRISDEAWKRKHVRVIAGIVLVLLLAFTLAVVRFGWDWTGFTGGYTITTHRVIQGVTTDTQQPPSKTLWDLLQLLIVPIILTIGGFWLNQVQKDREQKTEEAQKQREAYIAGEREKLERESREDNQRETALQTYIDKMYELLTQPVLGDQAREIARIRTLTVLPRLDGKRKGIVLQFLYEAHLIIGRITREEVYRDNPPLFLGDERIDPFFHLSHKQVITQPKFGGADFSGADLYACAFPLVQLSRVNLRGANLVSANLSFADLRGANMEMTNLIAANLIGADLRKIEIQPLDLNDLPETLRNALRYYEMHTTKLTEALLLGTNLDRANLEGAILQGAKYNRKEIHWENTEGIPYDIKPTQWPQGFDPEAAGAVCFDC